MVLKGCMVLNPNKYFYRCLRSKSPINDFILEDTTKIPQSLEHEVLRTAIDTNLNFSSHLKEICKKIVNKLNGLIRLIHYLDKTNKSSLFS